MSKSKFTRLAVFVIGTTLAIGGCAGSGWLPWVVGAGIVTTLFGQQGA